MFHQDPNLRNQELTWGVAPCPFGDIFVAHSPAGILRLSFIGCSDPAPWETLQRDFPDSKIHHQNPSANMIADLFFGRSPSTQLLELAPQGTAFQKTVWKELLNVPRGKTTTYSEIAGKIGCPKACRAVGNAVGKNPIALLIPCHRVMRSDGQCGGYRWGSGLKRTILAWEQQRPHDLTFSSLAKP